MSLPELEDTHVATASEGGSDVDAAELARGAEVGRYVVLGKLAAGGMGVVYAAYDPELDRKVAVKLLRAGEGAGGEARTRMLREALALARLSHPNVVAVHDVGSVGECVWLAMELVEGETLGAWCQRTRRGWPEVLAVMQAAGRGLAAAHAAGLVHRDFKPDNVMVGHDGRARVMDLGLARREASGDEPGSRITPAEGVPVRPEHAALTLQVTQAGAVVGTPAYMAPEQFAGAEVGVPADVFAYCVSFWEALFGERPFVGDQLISQIAAVMTGRPRVPPGRRVPGWLRRIVERGLARDPAQRWPSMPALLAALDRGRARAHLRTLAGALLVSAALAGAAWTWHRVDVNRRVAACAAAGASIDEVWNDRVRAGVRAALLAVGPSYAALSADKVMPWLDRQADAWRDAREQTCLDAELRGGDDTLHGRALWCLDERRTSLATLVAGLQEADELVARRSVTAAAGLERVDACRDPLALARLPTPPTGQRAAVLAVRAELARASHLQDASEHTEALAAARAAQVQAQQLEWPPLVAAARAREAVLLEQGGAYAEAELAAEDAYFAATAAGAVGVAADTASLLVYIAGHRLTRPVDGRRWARHAEQAIAALEPEPGLRTADLLDNRADVHVTAGEYPEARRLQEQSLAIRERLLGPEHPHVASCLNNIANTHDLQGEHPEARALYGRAMAIYEQALGPEHPHVGQIFNNLAIIEATAGNYAVARAHFERSLAIRAGALGPDHPDVASAYANLANIYKSMGDYPEARAMAERALAIQERTLGREHAQLAFTLNSLANIQRKLGEHEAARGHLERALALSERALGREHPTLGPILLNLAGLHHAIDAHAEAQALYERAAAIIEKTHGSEHANYARALAGLAAVRVAAGAHAEGRALYERALPLLEKTLGADNPDLAEPLLGLAECGLAEQAPARAVELAARAVALRERDAAPELLAEARFVLARAHAEAPADRGRDLARAHALAVQARDGLRGVAGKEEVLAEVERWLAKHHGR